MCDYRVESRKALDALPPSQARKALPPAAYAPLAKTLRRIGPGTDLADGRPLPAGSVERGHYYSPENYRRMLGRIARHPELCAWCGRPLRYPAATRHEIVREHFHPDCWNARGLAIAVIFGYAPPSAFGIHSPQRRHKPCVSESVEIVVRKVYRLSKSSLRRLKKGG